MGMGMSAGFDMGAAGFPNMAAMGAGMDPAQMQMMMMAMQNGMMPGGFGTFPPMGMSSLQLLHRTTY